MSKTKFSLKPLAFATLLAISIPATAQVQIPDGPLTADSSIGNQFPENLNWTPTCTDSSTCKSYAGLSDSSKLEAIKDPGINDGSENDSLGFQVDSSSAPSNKTIYVTDVNGIKGYLFGASNHNGFMTSSNMPAYLAENNLLVLDIQNSSQVEVSGTSKGDLNVGSVGAVANSKGGAKGNMTLIRNGNFKVTQQGSSSPGWHVVGAGIVEVTEDVTDNLVVIDGTQIVVDASLSPKVVSITAAKGYQGSSEVNMNNNSVWINNNSQIEGYLIAGALQYSSSGAGAVSSSSQNSVYISDSTLDLTAAKQDDFSNIFAGIYGAWGTGKAEKNWVEVENSTINIAADGNKAFTIAGTMDTKTAEHNAVVIRESTIDSKSPTLELLGGRTVEGTAEGNTVLLVDSQITGQTTVIYGGYTIQEANADGNSVYLIRTSISDGAQIIGGIAVTVGNAASASNNTVVIDDVTSIDGGRASFNRVLGGAIGSSGVIGGNTLYTSSSFDTTLLDGFQNFNFIVSPTWLNSGDAFINVTGTTSVTLQPNGNDHSTVALAGSKVTLNPGTYTLINSNAGFKDVNGNILTAETDLSSVKSDMNIKQVSSLIRIQNNSISKDDYELQIGGGDKELQISIGKVGNVDSTVNPSTDALMESSLSVAASLFSADDLLIDTALKSRNGSRMDGPFVAARAGTWNYDTNTRLDADVYTALFGWAVNMADVEFGPFVEMGHSNYNTRTKVEGVTERGSGKHNFMGAGVYANWQTPFYVRMTGYLKGGVIENHYNVNLLGRSTDFDRSSAYWGAHLGMNLDLALTEKLRARPFISYFYDGREKETYKQDGVGGVEGADFTYEALNLHRLQVGSMFEYAHTEKARPYFGLTYEQVIKGEAEGSAKDSLGTMRLNSSDIEGGTGIVSVGWSYLNDMKDFEFNFGVNGYAGARNGVSAQMNANWKF